MVDFSFDVNELFPGEITAVRSDLIPVGYLGNKNHSLIQQQVTQQKYYLTLQTLYKSDTLTAPFSINKIPVKQL